MKTQELKHRNVTRNHHREEPVSHWTDLELSRRLASFGAQFLKQTHDTHSCPNAHQQHTLKHTCAHGVMHPQPHLHSHWTRTRWLGAQAYSPCPRSSCGLQVSRSGCRSRKRQRVRKWERLREAHGHCARKGPHPVSSGVWCRCETLPTRAHQACCLAQDRSCKDQNLGMDRMRSG